MVGALSCPTCPRAANGSTADTFQPLWEKLCSQLEVGTLSIVLLYRTNTNAPGVARSKLVRGRLINCPAHQLSAREQGPAKTHAGCRLISDTDSVIVLVVSNPGKSRPKVLGAERVTCRCLSNPAGPLKEAHQGGASSQDTCRSLGVDSEQMMDSWAEWKL